MSPRRKCFRAMIGDAALIGFGIETFHDVHIGFQLRDQITDALHLYHLQFHAAALAFGVDIAELQGGVRP